MSQTADNRTLAVTRYLFLIHTPIPSGRFVPAFSERSVARNQTSSVLIVARIHLLSSARFAIRPPFVGCISCCVPTVYGLRSSFEHALGSANSGINLFLLAGYQFLPGLYNVARSLTSVARKSREILKPVIYSRRNGV